MNWLWNYNNEGFTVVITWKLWDYKIIFWHAGSLNVYKKVINNKIQY